MKPPVPPAPPGWNKTLDDLFAEAAQGLRPTIGSPEADWAREYERSLLPAELRQPQLGDIYEALEDTPAEYLVAWIDAPVTTDGTGTLKAGERIRICADPGPHKPLRVYAQPLDYHGFEQRSVPAAQRSHRKYGGLTLTVKTIDLHRAFRPVGRETGAAPSPDPSPGEGAPVRPTGDTRMPKAWDRRQVLSVRVSTLLLLCFPLALVAGAVSLLLPPAMAEPLQRLLGALLIANGVVSALAALVAFTLLLASVLRRNPQVQFLVELVVAGALFLLLPSH